jgi:hypothetical protein
VQTIEVDVALHRSMKRLGFSTGSLGHWIFQGTAGPVALAFLLLRRLLKPFQETAGPVALAFLLLWRLLKPFMVDPHGILIHHVHRRMVVKRKSSIGFIMYTEGWW